MSILVFVHAQTEGPCAIGRTLRDHGQQLRFVELYRNQSVPADLDEVDGIVSMGGPMNVEDAPKLPWISAEMAYLQMAHVAGVPIVGVCLGAQLIAAALGGEVKAMAAAEIGWHGIRLAFPGTIDPLLAGTPWNTTPFHLHGQEVTKLPPDSAPLAGSKLCKTQAFRVGLKTYGFQYHFEWNQSELAAALRDPFVTQTGHDPQAIAQQAQQHYPAYRRLGDRLCENIAELLLTAHPTPTAH